MACGFDPDRLPPCEKWLLRTKIWRGTWNRRKSCRNSCPTAQRERARDQGNGFLPRPGRNTSRSGATTGMHARGSRRAKASKRERRNEDRNGASARGPSGVDCISPATGAPVQCAVSTRSYSQLLHSGVPPSQWALVQGQRLLPCLPEAVTNPHRSSSKRTNDSAR